MIRLEQVGKIYHPGKPDQVIAIDDVSLEIPRGGVTVLKGPSGSGKTSLLAMIGCMSRPTHGQIVLDGREISRLPERFLTDIRRRTFGFIFQQFHLLEDLTVEENVLLPLYPQAVGYPEMKRRVAQVLAPLGLGAKQRRKAGQLSGGEQQRVAVARALIGDPEIIIADEPTAHLDSILAAELLVLLGGLLSAGRTLIIATHDPLVFNHQMVTQLVSMRDGRVLEEQTA
ncbi:MAG: ABC transporter ATP-binding protein [Proteobacteria bacterium]|nr:ABC transporter ATP-binding protein [Pseudomonadota bacterium]